jgi:hypothetical protein
MALVPPCYPWYALGTRFWQHGRFVVSRTRSVNAGTLKPVGWESIVYVNKNKAAVYMARRIMLRAGATGDAGGSVGGKARSTEA